MQTDKFPEEDRTFETRVRFIHEIFTNLQPKDMIMARCIQYKLGKSFDEYMKKLDKSYWTLNGEDPMVILKRIDRGERR